MSEDSGPVPDIYCDGVQITLGPYDAALHLTRRPDTAGSTESPTSVGCIRMSWEHAKVMVIMLRKVMQDHESVLGAAIPIHPQIRATLGISKEEDW